MLGYVIAFSLGVLILFLIGTVGYLHTQRTMLYKDNVRLFQTNQALNQKIVEAENMARVYAQREKEFMQKPLIATIRPEEARTMAKIIADSMHGKTATLAD